MQWLMDHGADVNMKSEQGWMLLDFAASGKAGGLDLRQQANRTAPAKFLLERTRS